MNIPEEYELLSFFESEPVESEPSDGFWCYEAGDLARVCLRFSFNLHEGSVQTTLIFNNEKVGTICHEGLLSMKIANDAGVESLKAEFDGHDYQTKLELRIKPEIYVYWWSLQR